MAAPRLTLVHRHDCALCDEMLAQLQALGRSIALPALDVIDVDSDPQLRRRHGLDVPVLLLDGAVVCRQRLDRGELARLLRAGRAARA
ncbi:MAG: glutaredoxin family protein [Gammaproteobacteria bacterium]|nr:MAG: glutaredoxin family protein [Gammaproteobacteria bacterium]TLY85843.1 MAG: glutaredoxin family protein [Gammaproteobacteria bacterium]